MLTALAITTLMTTATVPASVAETQTLSGEIRLLEGKTGLIHIYLVDEAAFRVPLHGLRKLTVLVDEAARERGKVSFRFEGLAPGRYGVRCFQDLDGDGQLGRGMFGPTEPWGMSWQKKRLLAIPRFADIAFQLDGDRSGMVIHLQ